MSGASQISGVQEPLRQVGIDDLRLQRYCQSATVSMTATTTLRACLHRCINSATLNSWKRSEHHYWRQVFKPILDTLKALESTIENPVAMPLTSTAYTVTGKDINNCHGMASVEVRVKGEAIVKKLKPSNFFSPDQGDAVNPYWIVEKIDEYPQCAVTIYDDKGVKVFDAKPYMNDWDGTFNGKRLPDGVYYYIIRCEGEESLPRSGSITVLR